MSDAPEGGESWSIRADAEHTLSSTRTLKSGDLFGVFDLAGDVPAGAAHGLYLHSTRFLSRFELRLCGQRPMLLGSTVREGNDQLVADLTNGDVRLPSGAELRRETVHLFRVRYLYEDAWQERVTITSFEVEPVDVSLEVRFEADWADIFEIRGTPRARRGTRRPPVVGTCAVELAYDGVDGVARHTRLELSDAPDHLDTASFRYDLRLEPGEQRVLYWRIAVQEDEPVGPLAPGDPRRHQERFELGRRTLLDARAEPCRVQSSSEAFDHWMLRSVQDLQMLTTDTPHGPYPYAGIPWYSCVFGRDGLITAFQTLWWKPDLARGVLGVLSAEQATEQDAEHDIEPGKIVHELRRGEMAATGEVPFGRYFGTVDATPLFVCLVGAYLQRTGDLDFVRRLWPAVERALGWMDTDGDPDGDGFLEYARRGAHGLVNQGWKDSYDAVMHADGSLVEAPVALCEVQAYAYAALREAARVAEALGHLDRAVELRDRSVVLAARFDRAFWSDEIGTYALALDGDERRCAVRASNAAHCLAFGIATPERAAAVVRQLSDPMFFTGWGLRTLASCERRYNPMSYHDGSVWPHDNAVAAYGASRYGHTDLAVRLLESLHDAARYLDLNRLPELFCGFERHEGRGPTQYPVSCAPQAWAAGAVFLLLQACLGLGIDARRQRVVLRNPHLPPFLETLVIENLTVGTSEIDLVLTRHDAENVSAQVVRRVGPCRVVLER
jgi:glycogen debranching enzyme